MMGRNLKILLLSMIVAAPLVLLAGCGPKQGVDTPLTPAENPTLDPATDSTMNPSK